MAAAGLLLLTQSGLITVTPVSHYQQGEKVHRRYLAMPVMKGPWLPSSRGTPQATQALKSIPNQHTHASFHPSVLC